MSMAPVMVRSNVISTYGFESWKQQTTNNPAMLQMLQKFSDIDDRVSYFKLYNNGASSDWMWQGCAL